MLPVTIIKNYNKMSLHQKFKSSVLKYLMKEQKSVLLSRRS